MTFLCHIGIMPQDKSRDPELTAVADHAWEGHRVEWNPNILVLAAKMRVRQVKEALIIHERDKKGKVTMNRDKGVELSAMWLDLF